jgi:hypothetical protein
VRQNFASRKLQLEQHPELRYVLSSGQSILMPRLADRPENQRRTGSVGETLGLLQKPFTADLLARKLRAVLEDTSG